MTVDSFLQYEPRLDVEYSYTELWIAHIHSGIYEYLTSSLGSCCKNEFVGIESSLCYCYY